MTTQLPFTRIGSRFILLIGVLTFPKGGFAQSPLTFTSYTEMRLSSFRGSMTQAYVVSVSKYAAKPGITAMFAMNTGRYALYTSLQNIYFCFLEGINQTGKLSIGFLLNKVKG